MYVFGYENQLYEALTEDEQEGLSEEVVKVIEMQQRMLEETKCEGADIVEEISQSQSTKVNGMDSSLEFDEEKYPSERQKLIRTSKSLKEIDISYNDFSAPDA